jgi:serine/threonine protein kinase
MMARSPRDDATVPAFSSPSQRSKNLRRDSGTRASPPRSDPNAKTFGPDGRYQAVEQLGRGSLGTVYKAYDHRLAKYVAIKAINVSDIPGNEIQEYVRLFDCEAKIAVQLDHPGIVTVLDYDPYATNPYIVMSLVDGGTLHDGFLAHPRMPWPEVADLGVQVAQALHYAHTHGVQAHRDVKPGNIFCAAGRYKVGDFGIARRVAVGRGVTRATFFSAGTPRYMAPEQILTPRHVDARTDLFSLAAVLYEALTGRSAFRGVTLDFDPEEDPSSARRIIDAAFRPPTPIRKLAPDVPPGIADAIERGLERDPAARFRDCAAFAKVLQEEAASHRAAPRSKAPRMRPRWVAAAALVLLAIAGYASWPWVEALSPSRRARAALTKKLDDADRRVDQMRAIAAQDRLNETEALAAEARSAVQREDLAGAQNAVEKVEQAVASLTLESLTIARTRAERARWEVAALRLERRNIQPEQVTAWEEAEKKYEEGKKQLEAANNAEDVAAAEAALQSFGEAKELLTRLNKTPPKSRR